jgi:hypothetical protein
VRRNVTGNALQQYGHSSLFAGLYFVVSQICGIAPRIKMHHSDPSMDRNVRMFRQLGQIFEPFFVMFRELKGK